MSTTDAAAEPVAAVPEGGPGGSDGSDGPGGLDRPGEREAVLPEASAVPSPEGSADADAEAPAEGDGGSASETGPGTGSVDGSASGSATGSGTGSADGDTAPGDGSDAGPGFPFGRIARRVRAGWPRWLRGWRRIGAAGAVVVLLAASGVLLYQAQQLRDPAATANRALTDAPATDEVVGDVSSGLTRIFSYSPQDTDATGQAAREVLTGTAAGQYQALFGQIQQQVAAQQLTLTTRVVRAGVVSLTATRAKLLVFLDQSSQRAGSTATSAAAQLSVTADRLDGHWRISSLTAR
ncbi:hypothetical protein [Actinacidiphila yeochonensis]|uniref:hypothetical protein n=1 Tax=Actinacidiphila yeochonensis TaxID=89050 RepID=UPI00068E510B|nr:hypothetical protein [Actinacidiphila yeochonensis]